MLQYVQDIASAVAALNGFHRRGFLHCISCRERINHTHLSNCQKLQWEHPVNATIWKQINRDALIRLK
jgi:hypothetical protein